MMFVVEKEGLPVKLVENDTGFLYRSIQYKKQKSIMGKRGDQ